MGYDTSPRHAAFTLDPPNDRRDRPPTHHGDRAGQDSVGTRVDIQHLAATPEGMPVEISAKITAVERRAATFEAVVRDVLDEVGRCTHRRFIVDLDKLKERLKAKIAKAKAQ